MGRKPRDLKGKIINNIKFLEKVGKNNNDKMIWLCECHCGNIWKVVGSSVTNGYTISCGCAKKKERGCLKWCDIKTVGYEVLSKDEKIYSNETINIKCDDCGNVGKRSSRYVYEKGYNCDLCNNVSMSYGERLFKSLLDYKGIEHEQEFIHPSLPHRRFDFKIGNTFYEINGEQHYKNGKKAFSNIEEVKKSDSEKEQFCKDMGFNIFFINVSSGKYVDLINRYKDALGIHENVDKNEILNIFYSYNRKTHEKEMSIIKDYNNGYLITDILKKYNIGRGSLSNILQRNGVKRERVKSKTEVVCVNNLVVYNSAREAALSVGLKNSGALYASLKDLKKSAGKGKNGNKLYWIKKEDLCNKYIDKDENEWYI